MSLFYLFTRFVFDFSVQINIKTQRIYRTGVFRKKSVCFACARLQYFCFISEICEYINVYVCVCVVWLFAVRALVCMSNIQNASFIFRSLLPRYKAPRRFTYCKKHTHSGTFTFSLYAQRSAKINSIYEYHKHSK